MKPSRAPFIPKKMHFRMEILKELVGCKVKEIEQFCQLLLVCSTRLVITIVSFLGHNSKQYIHVFK